eukprot:TRINITY_DN531_c0_g1_i1.p1 TRINITY_DN531_c0_g1~~TRINITY_DN531_c0_g1_i1.p1  ORF type:complete len:408 (-),score=70.96 TRINITY_DN531_c0_g1_i1:1396-2619(-)
MIQQNCLLVLTTILILGVKIKSQAESSTVVNQFTQKIQPLLCKEGKNCVISGYSIFNALGLTYAGALGDTQQQIQQVINLNGLNMQEVNQLFANLINSVSTVSNEIELVQANRLYGEVEAPFLKSYLDELKKSYNADAVNLDFANDPEGSRQEINAWVEEVTKNLIQNLLAPDSIKPSTISVLVSALYFNATWLRQFYGIRTELHKFTTSTGNIVNVPTMAQSGEKIVGDLLNVQASFIKLPYRGNDFSMYIIVPKSLSGQNANENIYSILQKITLENMFQGGTSRSVDLSLPKFTVEFQSSLLDTLQMLGMVDAFRMDAANFGGMVDLKNLGGNVRLSEVFHKAKIVVDETGTEAAAATVSIVIAVSGAAPSEVDFRVDQPFGYFIVKEPQNIVLFSGVVENPQIS